MSSGILIHQKPRDPGQILSHGQPIFIRCMLLAFESAQCGATAGDWALSITIKA